MNRRSFLAALTSALGALLVTGQRPTEAAPRVRRRVRRRIRRRHRRRVARRIVNGRSLLVVPVGLAVGWELVNDNRIVIVKQTKIVERDGAKVEIAIVEDEDGKTEEVEIVREDTADNKDELKGSTLSEDDTTTPAVETDK